jgi:hypothetical protein
MKIAYILPVNIKRFAYSIDNYLQTHFSVEIASEVAKKRHEVELHVFWSENTTYFDKNLKIYFVTTQLPFLNLHFTYDHRSHLYHGYHHISTFLYYFHLRRPSLKRLALEAI